MQELLIRGFFDKYIGCDIVFDLIVRNGEKFKGNRNIYFYCLDLLKNDLPVADVMMCRDCLFHFSYADTKLFLNNFIKSGIKFLLTTTHINKDNFSNKDIITGNWRWMDLFLEPYGFNLDPFYRFNDGVDREMCLWSRQQIIDINNKFLIS